MVFAKYAYDAKNGTTKYDVGVGVGGENGTTTITLTFPGTANSLYYDPTVAVANTGERLYFGPEGGGAPGSEDPIKVYMIKHMTTVLATLR